MKTENCDKVLYKLRVASEGTFCTQTNTRTGMHKTIVFNGISANSWLLPIGLSQKDRARDDGKRLVQVQKGGSTTANDMQGETGTQSEHTSGEEDRECEENHDEGGDNSTKPRRPQVPMTSKEFDILFQRVPTRPKSTGSVYIVRGPVTPVGLRRDTYLQGHHLRSKLEEAPPVESTYSPRLQERPRPFTAPGRSRHVRPDRRCVTPSWRSHPTRDCRDVGDAGKSDPLDASLDLVITPLDVNKVAVSRCAGQEVKPCPVDHHETPRHLQITPSASIPGTAAGDRVIAMGDGVKASQLRRAKSAPPKVRASLQVSSVGEVPGGSESGSGKRLSLYWKAKSAYHKKLLVYGHDPDPFDVSEAATSQVFRGSLWRPLLMQEDGQVVMQHSAGCPYKCKGCFKACLVSDDYLQKARAQKQRQQDSKSENASRTSSTALVQRKQKTDPGKLIFMALARSQPLYQMVHGSKSDSSSAGGERRDEEHSTGAVGINSGSDTGQTSARDLKDKDAKAADTTAAVAATTG